MSSNCPICETPDMQPFAGFLDVPATGVLCRDAGGYVPRRDLMFDYCGHCAFVSQRSGVAVSIDYREVARPTTRQLPAYAQRLITQLIESGQAGLTVEVGCNDGTFLDHLVTAGFTRCLGVEPSTALATAARSKGHTVVEQPLDIKVAQEIVLSHGAASRVVCRHTLEHVPEPLSFLAALRMLLVPGGLACIEVPSLAPIIEKLHIHELWDEHISYFLPENLQLALQKVGFSIENMCVEPYREMQNIVVWARATHPLKIDFQLEPIRRTQCANFSQSWQTVAEHLQREIAATPVPRVALGASHPQANFLNFAGLSEMVQAVIDDDAAKAGLWLPLKEGDLRIHPSSDLPELAAQGTLLLTGFGYPQWMGKMREAVEFGSTTVIDVTELIESASPMKERAA